MIKALKIIGIFISGIFVGALLMNLLDMYLRPAYREALMISFKTEQEFSASRAIREGNQVKAMVYRWNVVHAESKDGYRTFKKDRNKEMDTSFFYPFHMYALNSMLLNRDSTFEKGGLIAEGIGRGKLAVSLEAIGSHEEAARQWDIAHKLIGKKSIEETKNLISRLQTIDNTEQHIKAEKAVLDSNESPTNQ